MNKVILIGNVGKEPEIRCRRRNKGGAILCSPQQRKDYTTKDGKKIEDRTEWHNIVAWRGLASLSEYIHKGTTVGVEGNYLSEVTRKTGQPVI